MTNDDQNRLGYMDGYVSCSAEEGQGISWPMLMLFFMIVGYSPKIESMGDLKNVVSDFNDRIQKMEIPYLEGSANED